ncbi:MAG TPA: M23 family metallopeptidase [Candidatus Dormibacteraeota bacterium]
MIGLVRAGAILGGLCGVWLVAASQVPSHERLPLAAVVPRAVVTLPFGCTSLSLEPFDPFCPGGHIHTGIDLAAPIGSEVRSATGGTARLGFDPSGAGLYVAVRADAQTRLLYCHLSAFRVRDGDTVVAGQVVGLVGATGRATGPHVHFEIQVDGASVDPAKWLAADPVLTGWVGAR